MATLLTKADTAVKENRLDDYFNIRKEMEELTDEANDLQVLSSGQESETLTDEEPRMTGTWRDQAEDLQLVKHLTRPYKSREETAEQAATYDELARRGYSESELHAAFMFGVEKRLKDDKGGDKVCMNVGTYINSHMHIEETYDAEISDAEIKRITRESFGFVPPEVTGFDSRNQIWIHKTNIQLYCSRILDAVKKAARQEHSPEQVAKVNHNPFVDIFI